MTMPRDWLDSVVEYWPVAAFAVVAVALFVVTSLINQRSQREREKAQREWEHLQAKVDSIESTLESIDQKVSRLTDRDA